MFSFDSPPFPAFYHLKVQAKENHCISEKYLLQNCEETFHKRDSEAISGNVIQPQYKCQEAFAIKH